MFTIKEEQVSREVTENALWAVHDICKWAYGDRALVECWYRVAPSLITRSEAEIFGLSSPRFAYRLGLNNGSFFNLRRLQTLANRASREHGMPFSHFSGLSKNAIQSTLLGPITAIADSLLALPRWANDAKYHILKTDLSRFYGEPDSFHGVPYLQHIELGGGLCSQAACLMVLLHYHDIVNEIGGIPEITSWAKGEQDGTVCMSGLRDSEVASFLCSRTTGLRTWHQIGNRDIDEKHSDEHTALLAYTCSDVPVILPVDLGRLYNTLLEKNGVFERIGKYQKYRAPRGTQPHMVLVGGCRTDGQEFVLHDPATVPFLRCSFEEILNIRRYQQRHSWISAKRPGVFVFFPVVQRDVQLPLLDVRIRDWEQKTLGNDLGKPERGLINAARNCHINFPGVTLNNGSVVGPFDRDEYSPGHYLLFCGSDAGSSARLDSFLERYVSDVEMIRGALDKILSECGSTDRWIWIQITNCPDKNALPIVPVIWLWDAQMPVRKPGPNFWREQLIGVIKDLPIAPYASFSSRRLSDKLPNCLQTQTIQYSGVSSSVPLAAPALISSFNPTSEPIDQLEQIDQTKNCELYLLMEGAEKNRRVDDAVDFLASMKPEESDTFGVELANRYRGRGIEIVSVATFIPEISRAPNSSSARRFVKAMGNIGRVVSALKRENHSVKCVEIVGGSRVQGLGSQSSFLSRMGVRPTTYFVALEQSSVCLGNIATNLHSVISNTWPADVPLAFELEPGSLFVINNLESITDLVELIDNDNVLRDIVGLNLDISHWRLSGIALAKTHVPEEESSIISKRVVHAHLSGHHKRAHFGDVPPTLGVTPTEHRDWLTYFRYCGNLENRRVLHSNLVSLELEAARDMETVRRSLDELVDILS